MAEPSESLVVVKWTLRNIVAIGAVLSFLITSSAIATALQIQVHSSRDKITQTEASIKKLEGDVADGKSRLNELTQDLRYIRKELDRANVILDKIDKRMP